MTKIKTNPNQPLPAKEIVEPTTEWKTENIDANKIPYVSHVPKNPIRMTHDRKKRIRKVLQLKNKGYTPEQIADELEIPLILIKRDLTTAVTLTGKNLPFVPAEDRALMRDAVTSYTNEAKDLFERIKTVVTTLEEKEAYLDPKAAMSFAMIIGELRQTLELGAKLTGELQSGTRVNVVMFSGMVKRLIEIVGEEVDRTTFIRIRDRMKLEMGGKQPLGDKGGEVIIDANPANN
jgi:hypothetical protein